ncbi:hypothetical protein HMPREF1990_02232 [Porphyromonas gingivalis W4087]|nr:hypothetical protein HMPREF1989_01801 [Porphyromonas gingivalis F0566]ERJ85478.1 hypothetical protein HMPREF1990_02232 [Porphyromonas gingivalis W4087]
MGVKTCEAYLSFEQLIALSSYHKTPLKYVPKKFSTTKKSLESFQISVRKETDFEIGKMKN